MPHPQDNHAGQDHAGLGEMPGEALTAAGGALAVNPVCDILLALSGA